MSNIKIPKKLKICGFDYEVILRDRSNEDGVMNSGTHYNYLQKIWIDNQTHLQQQEESFLHEIIEAINSNNDLQLNHQQICVLSCCLYQVLKDNRLLR